jgi:acetolactate synthase-1/2/3 large subunit
MTSSQTTNTAARLFGQTLAGLGIRHLFTLSGSHINPLLGGCEDAGLRIIDTRHEATAGHAIEGLAKSTGQPGVCLVTAGPGLTNTLTAMMSCYVDAAPAIFVAGAAALHNAGPNPLQGGFSQIDMARPVCKWTAVAEHADQIPTLLRQAWQTALAGRPGPVFIEIPSDIAHSTGSPSAHVTAPFEIDAATTCIPDATIEEVVQRLSQARHPIVVAGAGVRYAKAHAMLQQLAERAGLPVFTNFDSHGVLPGESPCWCGSLNLSSRLPAASECDLLLVIGARLGLLTGGLPGRFSNPDLSIVQIDIHADELVHLRPRDLGITADCGQFLNQLSHRLETSNQPSWQAWLAEIQTSRRAQLAAWQDQSSAPGLIHPFHAARCIEEALPPGTIHVVDGGETKHWVELNLSPSRPGRYISRAYSGTLGSGQGLALGACLANDGAPVCQIIGDGAWGFQLQEIDTYLRHDVPIITVVFNNGVWGAIRHLQEKLWNNQRYVATDLGFTPYDQVAAGFGCAARRVDTLDALVATLREALASGQPWVIDVLVDPDPDPLASPIRAS